MSTIHTNPQGRSGTAVKDPKRTAKLEHWISKRVGQAMTDFAMLDEGDRILVAISGGKDSLTLLKVLKARQKRVPIRHEIIALHVLSNYTCGGADNEEDLRQFCRGIDVEYHMAPLNISLDMGQKKIGLNCFWCSWNRKKVLFEWADRLGCKKVALGHHKDDIIETTLMNLLFQGEISTMVPKQSFFDGRILIIRPLCYVEEDMIRAYARASGFVDSFCNCPAGRQSNRKRIRDIIEHMKRICPGVKNNIFYAPGRINSEYLPRFGKIPPAGTPTTGE
ncbi:MAG: hypothetical protein JW844_03325 [Candidatus Omnitrophica bacterium]|nr:hypothetical protein [Candidatus Omnitrophota bacterium]